MAADRRASVALQHTKEFPCGWPSCPKVRIQSSWIHNMTDPVRVLTCSPQPCRSSIANPTSSGTFASIPMTVPTFAPGATATKASSSAALSQSTYVLIPARSLIAASMKVVGNASRTCVSFLAQVNAMLTVMQSLPAWPDIVGSTPAAGRTDVRLRAVRCKPNPTASHRH